MFLLPIFMYVALAANFRSDCGLDYWNKVMTYTDDDCRQMKGEELNFLLSDSCGHHGDQFERSVMLSFCTKHFSNWDEYFSITPVPYRDFKIREMENWYIYFFDRELFLDEVVNESWTRIFASFGSFDLEKQPVSLTVLKLNRLREAFELFFFDAEQIKVQIYISALKVLLNPLVHYSEKLAKIDEIGQQDNDHVALTHVNWLEEEPPEQELAGIKRDELRILGRLVRGEKATTHLAKTFYNSMIRVWDNIIV